MCRASHQPFDHIGARFASVMAGTAQRDEVGYRVGLADRPRNNVVNVKPLALSIKRGFRLSATLASPAVSHSSGFGRRGPVGTPSIVRGCAALPLRAVGTAFRPRARCGVATMAAKPARFTVKRLKGISAMVASLTSRLHPAPAGLVVASHIAKPPRSDLVSGSLKAFAAAFARFHDARPGLPFAAFGATVPRRPPVRPRAVMPAILPVPVAGEGFPALGACVVNWFCHGKTITRTRLDNKHFAIACKRVDEAARQPDLLIPETRTAPVQQGLDL